MLISECVGVVRIRLRVYGIDYLILRVVKLLPFDVLVCFTDILVPLGCVGEERLVVPQLEI